MSTNPTDETLICPYAGLRSFTEEESLYFKGRDEQVDQVTRLLEKNKFLMLTGASGEGKSSLIYAGLIPNARAGFFKARYGNWVVTDFRPERNPVKNMAGAVAETFGAQATTVETELRRGYSSLIDLYTNSSFYVDETDAAWGSMNETERKNKTRGAANLLIIVDQFEEFFTNPENYLNDAPSQDSQIVVNLVLETARIALQRHLPVYIVCTMRSDYIGQCSAFRGLPEYIGFSQFFVPRLKRKEIKQIIEEPAVLSGNSITRRLVERLVYDLADGIDQLPILQHALRQIWLIASARGEEMDLIHYAMVGGMPLEELPEDSQPRYTQWFNGVPETQKKFYQQQGLNRVLEIHASRLYESAWVNYNEKHPGAPITQKDSKRIIALTFACLTKIDDSRAVRSRMTLGEITNIVNQPELTTEVVAGVLDLFRENNNSFVRPYITDETDSHQLTKDTVLDITHESLIRNWALLNKWANQEFEFYTTFVDLKKQLARWNASGKSSDFLLPLGPLTFFENWYTRCQPNIHWINRYTENKTDAEQALKDSASTLNDIREYIRRSARKVMLSRLFMQYGAQKIAIVFALAAMVFMTGFYWYDAEQKTNKQVEKFVKEKAHRLVQSKNVSSLNKATYLLMEERLQKGSLIPFLSAQADQKDKIELSIAAYRLILYFDKHTRTSLKTELRDLILQGLAAYPAESQEKATFLLEQQNQLLLLLAYDEYYNPSADMADVIIPRIAHSQQQVVMFFLTRMDAYKQIVPTQLNLGIQLWLTFGKPGQQDIHTVLDKVTPFGDSTSRKVFDFYYVKGNNEGNGRIPSDYSGGYHTLASLYSAAGEADHIIQCFAMLPDSYFRSTLFNNYNNLIGYLYQYQHQDQARIIVKWLNDHVESDNPLTVYRNTIIRSGYIPGLYGINLEKLFARSHSGFVHPNLGLSSRQQFFELAAEYERIAKEVKDADERNYFLAMHYKRIAILYDKYCYDRGLTADPKQMESWLDLAWTHFKQIGSRHLDGTVAVNYRYFTDGIRTFQTPRRMVFLFPDYRDGWFANRFNTDVFFKHALRKGFLAEYYNTPETISLIHEWVGAGHEPFLFMREGEGTAYFQNDFKLSDELLEQILDFAKASPASSAFDKNLIYLVLANRSFERGEQEKGLKYYQLLEKEKLMASGKKYEYLYQTYFINATMTLTANLMKSGLQKEALNIVKPFQPYEKAFFYITLADKLYEKYEPAAFTFLDSAYATVAALDYNKILVGGDIDARKPLIYFMGKVGGDRVNQLSRGMIRELDEARRIQTTISMILGISMDGNYYTALKAMPDELTENQELICYSSILGQAVRAQTSQAEWLGMDEALLHEYHYFLSPF